MLMNTSVDTGYGYLMGETKVGKVIMPSYIEEISQVSFKENKKTIEKINERNLLVEFNKKYYAVGKLATKIKPDTQRNLTNSRVQNDEHLVSMLSVVSLLTNSNNTDINIGLGLPQQLISDAEALEGWVKGKFEITLHSKDKEIKKTINIKNSMCMNQGLAPIYLLEDDELEKNIISVDLGHNTFHSVYWSDYNAPLELRRHGKGMRTCYDDLRVRLENMETEDRIINVTQQELERAIESGVFVRNKKKIDITDMLNEVFETKAKELFRTIESAYSDLLTSVDIIIFNGGAMQNENFITKLGEMFKKYYNIEFIIFEEPQWAVTKGILRCLNDEFEDDFGDIEDEDNQQGAEEEIAVTSDVVEEDNTDNNNDEIGE